MTAPTVQFLFDFGSPNAYFCHRVIPAIESRSGVRFQYVPILLGGLFKLTQNRSPVEAFAGIANKRAYDQLEIDRFVKKHGLSRYRFNPHFPVNTLGIMRGAVAAQALGVFDRYVDVMYAGMWEEGLNLSDPEVIQAHLSAHGLDAQALMQGTQSPEVKATLMANTQEAAERGAFGSPTFFVGREIFFGKDRLREVEEEIANQKAMGS